MPASNVISPRRSPVAVRLSDPVDGSVRDIAIAVDGTISAAPAADCGSGIYCTEGLIDLQVNGFTGVDFNRPGVTADMLDRALADMALTGVSRVLPTLITGSPDHLRQCLADLDRAVSQSRLGPLMVAGYHIEGPFLSPEEGYRGAHAAADMTRADIGLYDELQAVAERPIRIVTVAPEVEGVLEMIPALAARGIVVSIGHSAADPSAIAAAVSAGARLSTHLGNGLPKLLDRTSNPVFWQLAEDGLTAMFIGDGIHVPAGTLKAMLRAKGIERAILTTDAVCAAGRAMQAGRYTLGSTEVERAADGSVRIPGSVYLAGSSATMDQMLCNLMAWYDMPLSTAFTLMRTNPARVLGEEREKRLAGQSAQIIEWEQVADGLRVRRAHIGPFTIEAG